MVAENVDALTKEIMIVAIEQSGGDGMNRRGDEPEWLRVGRRR